MATNYWTSTNYDLSTAVEVLFVALDQRIRALDGQVRVTSRAERYITYGHTQMKGGFTRIVTNQTSLNVKLSIIRSHQIHDPRNWCADATAYYRSTWSRARLEVDFSSLKDIDYIMSLVKQAYKTCLEHDRRRN